LEQRQLHTQLDPFSHGGSSEETLPACTCSEAAAKALDHAVLDDIVRARLTAEPRRVVHRALAVLGERRHRVPARLAWLVLALDAHRITWSDAGLVGQAIGRIASWVVGAAHSARRRAPRLRPPTRPEATPCGLTRADRGGSCVPWSSFLVRWPTG